LTRAAILASLPDLAGEGLVRPGPRSLHWCHIFFDFYQPGLV